MRDSKAEACAERDWEISIWNICVAKWGQAHRWYFISQSLFLSCTAYGPEIKDLALMTCYLI